MFYKQQADKLKSSQSVELQNELRQVIISVRTGDNMRDVKQYLEDEGVTNVTLFNHGYQNLRLIGTPSV